MSDSDLRAAETARGAVMTTVEGGETPAHFGDAEAEYRALRTGAGLVDHGLDAVLRVTGDDRSDFLHGMLSCNVKALAAGEGCRTFVLTDQGKVVADAALVLTESANVLIGAAGGIAAAQPALERFIVADDVELHPSEDVHVLGLYGPAAPAVLTALGVAGPPPTDAYHHTVVALGGGTMLVVRVPAPGAGGYVCVVPANEVAGWWTRAAAADEVAPVGHDAFELARIESGVARHGRDVTSDTLALEAPHEDAISFEKGCYLGQEIVERVTARGKVNRRLVGLVVAGSEAPAPGDKLVAGDREVGWLTSVAWSWDRGCSVALGYVRREHFAPGTTLDVRGASATEATVTALPLG